MNETPLNVKVIIPEREILSADIHAATIPGVEGEMTILPDHAPIITQLKPAGFITIRHGDKQKEENILVRQGFAEVSEGKITILAQEAVTESENQKEHIQKWIEEAEKSDQKIQNGMDIPDLLKRLRDQM